MKKWMMICVMVIAETNLFAQLPGPVKFTYSIKQVSGKNYELHVLATLDEGWHLYSQTQPKQAVAKPTTILINKNPLLVIAPGKAKEIGKKEMYENKEVDIKQYQYGHRVEFVQAFSVKTNVKTNLTGTVTYQVCTDERCLPVKTISFNLPIETK